MLLMMGKDLRLVFLGRRRAWTMVVPSGAMAFEHSGDRPRARGLRALPGQVSERGKTWCFASR